MPATPEIHPAPFSFTAALTPAQIEAAASTVDPAAVTSRALMACMKLDSAEMIAAWRSEPDAFMELFDSAPAAIEKAKVVLEILEKGYHRLMLTGAFALNEPSAKN